MPFSILPFLLLAIPIVEIGVFIAVGDRIGIFYTLGMILLTALLGSILLRIKGFRVLARIRQQMSAGQMPAKELTDGVMILIAGVLLLTPGFLTDAIGFLLFLTPVRAAIRAFLVSRIDLSSMAGKASFDNSGQSFRASSDKGHAGPTVDLDEDAWHSEKDSSSPWHSEAEDADRQKQDPGFRLKKPDPGPQK